MYGLVFRQHFDAQCSCNILQVVDACSTDFSYVEVKGHILLKITSKFVAVALDVLEAKTMSSRVTTWSDSIAFWGFNTITSV